MIERKIVIGLITSTDFIKQVRGEITADLFDSDSAAEISRWCLDYFDEFHTAPGRGMEQLFYEKVRTKKVRKDKVEEYEQLILPSLSEEFDGGGIVLDVLLKDTRAWFRDQRLLRVRDTIDEALEKGEPDEAEKAVEGYRAQRQSEGVLLRFDSPEIRGAVRKAFSASLTPLFEYPGILGQFWNDQLIRGNFIGFLAPEKRGKSWLMLDMALRAVQQGVSVAFFQAGDMTQEQQLRRIATKITGRVCREKYEGLNWIPCQDCVRNQLNTCEKEIRECSFGVFEDRGWNEADLRREVTRDDLVEAYKLNKGYAPCFNCKEYFQKPLGAVWYTHKNLRLLELEQAERALYRYFFKKHRQFRMSTHFNGSLSVKGMRQVLNSWNLQDGFIPGLIVLDYADLMVPSYQTEYRHQQNQIWKDLRGLNQELDCLLVTATQADADSYDRNSLRLKNFSEDKRKYGHVTTMYGLNQDSKGREKGIGLIRINELLLRDDGFDSSREVTILQSLSTGSPVVGSFF